MKKSVPNLSFGQAHFFAIVTYIVILPRRLWFGLVYLLTGSLECKTRFVGGSYKFLFAAAVVPISIQKLNIAFAGMKQIPLEDTPLYEDSMKAAWDREAFDLCKRVYYPRKPQNLLDRYLELKVIEPNFYEHFSNMDLVLYHHINRMCDADNAEQLDLTKKDKKENEI